ncbi:MAG: transketolase C-terminal domain-containing protein, partial [Peptococcaceae bacterium]|nr:transketolase C-terminal domain-containing protein [Peptococcaceae bacterium]
SFLTLYYTDSVGISAAVIDMSTIKPIDRALISEWAEKTGAIVTAEEHNIYGGLGSAVAEVLVETQPVPMARVGIEDVFGESGTSDALLEKYGLTAAHIVEAAKATVARKK